MVGSGHTRVVRSLVLAGYSGLLLVLLFRQWLLVLPLLCFAWGLWRCHWRSHIWLCFVLLFYFLLNVNHLAQSPRLLLWFEGFLIVVLFTSAMLWCRWSKRQQALTDRVGESCS